MHRLVLKCGRFYRSIPIFINNSVNNYNKSFPRLHYSTTSSSIGSQILSKDRNESRVEQQIHIRDDIKLNKNNEIDSIKVFADQKIIRLNFINGQVLNFNTIWLRDSCHCQQCVHPITKTKLINCADISEDLFVDRINCANNVIEIYWRDGQTSEHVSHYSVNWLLMFADIFKPSPQTTDDLNSPLIVPNDGIYGPISPKAEQVYWNSSLMDKNKFKVNFNDFMTDIKALKKVIEMICRFGVAFIECVPIEKNTILEVARRIAYEKKTGYGLTFDVKFNPDPNTHLSYTGAKFEPHVDLAYRERSPGIQMLHCLEQASVGGQSFLVDGFACAHKLRETNSELFDILVKYPVLFSFCDAERGLWFREKWPIIQVDDNQSIKEIHYSDFSMRAPLLPGHRLDQFYKAYRFGLNFLFTFKLIYRLMIPFSINWFCFCCFETMIGF